MRVIRRTPAQRRRAQLAQATARATKWLVWSKFDGDNTLVGTFDDPSEARRVARDMWQSTRIRHVVRLVAA